MVKRGYFMNQALCLMFLIMFLVLSLVFGFICAGLLSGCN